MIACPALMFAITVLFVGIAAAIYRGNTNLIHDDHQRHIKETDQKNYGKAFSKGLFVLSAALILSGLIALLGSNPSVVMVSAGVLLIGILLAFIILAKVQKKFNGGF